MYQSMNQLRKKLKLDVSKVIYFMCIIFICFNIYIYIYIYIYSIDDNNNNNTITTCIYIEFYNIVKFNK